MIKRKIVSISTLLFFIMFAPGINAFEVNVEFSAEALQVSPGQSPVYSKMFVSKKAVRSESYIAGKYVVDITFPYQGRRITLYPETQQYSDSTNFPVVQERGSTDSKTPCDGMPDTQCEKIGHDIVNGIHVEKWQIEKKIKGNTFKILQWIDTQRNLSLREMNPDGSIAELKTVGKNNLYGRDVEIWEYVMSSAAGIRQVSKQWYDPELKIVIQEEKQGGYFRGFKNIKTGKQNKSLFEIPASYQRMAENK